MRKFVAAAVTAAVLTLFTFAGGAQAIHTGWFAPDGSDKIKNSYAGKADAAAEGEKIYKKNCIKCHGENGKPGEGPSAGSLQIELPDFASKEVTAEETDGEWFWKIRTGQFEMPPFQIILSDDEIWKVIVHLRTLAK